MKYALLAIDIDGTLHTSDREIPHSVPPYLMELEERGVLVMLCTGRRYRTALPIYDSLLLMGPIVLHSGALVMNPPDGERLYAQYLDVPAAARCCAMMREEALQPLVWEDNYPDSPDFIAAAGYTGFTKEYVDRHAEFTAEVEDLRRLDSPRILEVGAWDRFDALASVADKIAGEFGGSVRVHIARDIIDGRSILEVMSPRAGKWNAVRHLADIHGIAGDAIAAVGDNYNDIELIANAGFGVAMGNAVDSVKAAAEHVTSSNDEEGLYTALRKIFG